MSNNEVIVTVGVLVIFAVWLSREIIELRADVRELKSWAKNPNYFEDLKTQERERALREKQKAKVKKLVVGTRVCVSDYKGKSFGTITKVDERDGETFTVYFDEDDREVVQDASGLEDFEFV
jgi:hypothetical protein